MAKRVFMVQQRQADLLDLALALVPIRAHAHLGNRRKQQRHQQTEDSDHDQQFFERERAPQISSCDKAPGVEILTEPDKPMNGNL